MLWVLGHFLVVEIFNLNVQLLENFVKNVLKTKLDIVKRVSFTRHYYFIRQQIFLATKTLCEGTCKDVQGYSETFCHAPSPTEVKCCPVNSHGGCSVAQSDEVTVEVDAFHCEKGYFLQVNSHNLKAPRKCAAGCFGKIINGTDICVVLSNACPGMP